MKPIILEITTLRTRCSSVSTRGNSYNFSFSYSSRIEKVGETLIDKNSKIKVYLKKKGLSTYEGFRLQKEDICFLKSKIENAGDVLSCVFDRKGSSHFSVDSGFVFYKGSLYLAKITKQEAILNGSNALDSNEIRTPYTIELFKKLNLPLSDKISEIKSKYKFGKESYIWDKETQDFILNN